jgi:hypothetical protein
MITFIFLSTVFTTFFTMSILWYAQFSAYPQFKWISDLGSKAFLVIHGRYVSNLWISTYCPIILNIVSTLLLLFTRPSNIPLGVPIALNAFNILGMIATFGWAVPIHVRIDREQLYTIRDLDNLLRANAFRLICVTINSVILLYVLKQILVV